MPAMQGRLFFIASLSYLEQALSMMHASSSCERAAPGVALKIEAPAALRVDQPLSAPAAAGCCPPLKASPSKLRVDLPPPFTCGESSLSAPSLTLADIKRELLQRSGKGWKDHFRTIWEANSSCRAAGYPESSVEELYRGWGHDSVCTGWPSPVDVPTRSQAAARESGVEVLRALRELAGLVWPEHAAAASASAARRDVVGDPGLYADWEMLQAELLSSSSSPPSEARVPAAVTCSWGEATWCSNPACTNLEGPSELALETRPCGGGCGLRYCSPECQARGWRDGHRLSCARLRDRRVAVVAQ